MCAYLDGSTHLINKGIAKQGCMCSCMYMQYVVNVFSQYIYTYTSLVEQSIAKSTIPAAISDGT